MGKQPVISIIVPVYNTAGELKRCVDSLLGQTCKEKMEIILVDDGSTDGSEKMCDGYGEQYAQIRVIHQPNAGVVAARKAGTRAASGKYLAFMDSDDYADWEMYQTLLEIAWKTGADMISCGFIREYFGEGEQLFAGTPEYDAFEEGEYCADKKQALLKDFICFQGFSREGITPFLWTKLFKRELLLGNLDRVPEEITYGEDACLTYMCCMDAGKIYVLHKALYHYCMRQNSCVHGYDRRCFLELDAMYECLHEKIQEQPEYLEELSGQMEKYVAKQAIYCLRQRFGFSNGGMLPAYCVALGDRLMGSRLVLYGAGRVGTSYYKQITGLGQADIVLWVDRNPEQVKNNPLVQPVELLQKAEYDYILIGVKQKVAAEQIREQLASMGIEAEKIVWEEPRFILDIYNRV